MLLALPILGTLLALRLIPTDLSERKRLSTVT
jgi:hypothetical protein